MRQATAGARLLESFLFALSSLLLYYFGVGVLFFLIPLQVLGVRRGPHGFAAGAGLFLAMLAGVRLVTVLPSAGMSTEAGLMMAVEGFGIVILLLGLLAVNLPWPRGARTLLKMLGAAGLAGLASIPVAIWLAGSPAFTRAMEAVFADMAKMIGSLFATADGNAAAVLATMLEPSKLMEFTRAWFLRSFVAGYLALLAFSWWAGSASAARSIAFRAGAHPAANPGPRLAEFRLESLFLWPFIASWAAIGLDLLLGLSVLSYAVWNIGLAMLFLYGLQGLAILRFHFEKRRLPRILWFVLVVGLAVLAASPRVGLVVVVAVPLFGISENWIRYRVRATRGTDERKE